jgi:hypothetical protein
MKGEERQETPSKMRLAQVEETPEITCTGNCYDQEWKKSQTSL